MSEGFVDISRTFPKESMTLKVVLIITVFLFFAGIISPMITLKKFVLVENTFSVLSGIIELLKEGKYFVFLIITGFSLVLPLLKFGVLFQILHGNRGRAVHLDKYLHWMHLFGKWSMLDVFVVAVLVVAVKLGVVASVEMRYGLYAFAASVVLTMYVTARVVSLSEKLKDGK